jgi:hypothetical protein
LLSCTLQLVCPVQAWLLGIATDGCLRYFPRSRLRHVLPPLAPAASLPFHPTQHAPWPLLLLLLLLPFLSHQAMWTRQCPTGAAPCAPLPPAGRPWSCCSR